MLMRALQQVSQLVGGKRLWQALQSLFFKELFQQVYAILQCRGSFPSSREFDIVSLVYILVLWTYMYVLCDIMIRQEKL